MECLLIELNHFFRAHKENRYFIRKLSVLLIIFFLSVINVNSQNQIVTENAIAGNPSSEWQISGAGDLTIQGFSTDISVNKGANIGFKINVTGTNKNFSIKIYRIGYYQGNGARLISNLGEFSGVEQPLPLRDEASGLIDCGNWTQSASWTVPANAVSGVYIARLERSDNQGASHIVFIVRNDASNADLLFKTSDATWQAYNVYGGNSLYTGTTPGFPSGHATKVSYNRPFITRNGGGGGGPSVDWLFNAEYPMIRWLERNGYNVHYTTDLDMARDQTPITPAKYKAILSVGHDEYWSKEERNRVEAARNAGVNLAFFSGNEVYWKTRWESSIDGSGTDFRTLVCYKEGTLGENACNGECDPTLIWTGLWRDGCGATNATDGCEPENKLTGQMSWTESSTSIIVPDKYKNLRFWRNTSVASLNDGESITLPIGTLGYEWDFEQSEFIRTNPAGRFALSSTTVADKTHKLSLFRHSSGALVFGAGTVQWSWGLDNEHDRGNTAASPIMQQATVNLFADMGIQPETIQNGLILAVASTDNIAPVSSITSPLNAENIPFGIPMSISGTASDLGGGVLAAVEVSTDGGITWNLAEGTSNWTYTWTPNVYGEVTATILSRAVDDNGNLEAIGTPVSANAITVTIAPPPAPICPCNIFESTDIPALFNNDNSGGINVGVKFRTYLNGFITGIRFYKGAGATGTFTGILYSSTGTVLANATFTSLTSSGWQEISFSTPVPVVAGTTYVASYFSSAGFYSVTNPFFTGPTLKYPLIALAKGTDGLNGLYQYGNSPAFPINNYLSGNYWVDVVFNTSIPPDITAPQVESVIPASNATNINTSSSIKIIINEAIDESTISGSTLDIRNALNQLVPFTFSYNIVNRTITLIPSSPLDYQSVYTVNLKGGTVDPRIKDLAGNPLAATYSWSFTTASQPVPPPVPPVDGPGGPILVISSSVNPFSRYAAEILKAEGWNEYQVKDISQVNVADLNNYKVVILGQISLSASQVSMLNDWTVAGGTLIAFKPDVQLSSLFGITFSGTGLSEGYLLVNTASGAGIGIVGESIQFHGTADRYTVNAGTNVIATLYADAVTATSNPAVTSRDVGSNGGQAIAFTFDLAKSIIYTRQGNPAWSGQERDQQPGPIRSNDLFFGNKPGDIQKDWIDLNKVSIPQADEQQRLLSNIILKGNLDKNPLPRFWFLPKGLKAAVVMTGDDHANGGTVERFNQYLGLSGSNNTPENVADWLAIRSTSYIYPGTPITNEQAISYQQAGFEIGLHVNTDCQNFTESSLETAWTQQLLSFSSQIPGIATPVTNRTHCLAWSDWATQAKVQAARGVRLDVNYYYWPGVWIQNRSGMFTGSAMPMPFADTDGSVINCYQVTTQMTDESGQIYPGFVNALLDKAIGSEGYYGVFCANMHTDNASASDISTIGSNQIVASAVSRGIPVISSKQMLDWLDGRNSASFSNISWAANQLSFTITSDNVFARNIQAMLPKFSNSGVITSITYNGSTLPFEVKLVKGIEYAFFAAPTGNYVASYVLDNTPPVITNIQVTTNNDGTAVINWETNELADSRIDYGITPTDLSLSLSNPSLVLSHSLTLTGLTPLTTYYFRVTSKDGVNNSATSPENPAAPGNFTMPCTIDGQLVAAGITCAGQEINLKFNSPTGQAPFTLVLNGSTINNVSNNTTFASGIFANPVSDATIWPPSAIVGSFANDPNSVELGVKFRSDIPGIVKGIRFYKTIESGAGVFPVKLWNYSTGNLVSTSSITFSNPNEQGWKVAYFAAPVSIDSNTTYIATYIAPNGKYAVTPNSFSTSYNFDGGPLTALGDGVDGPNGVYRYGGGNLMPIESFQSSNYWVDIVFNAASPVTLSRITDASGCDKSGANLQTLYVNGLDCAFFPVSLVDFTLNARNNDVTLNWSTSSENNNLGFEIERSIDGQVWTKIGFVQGAGNSQVLKKYQYLDINLKPSKYFYRLKQVDNNGRFEYSKVIFTNIGGSLVYSLEQNYPNPSSSSTVINYTLPVKAQVDIVLFDSQGRVVKSLLSGSKDAGTYSVTLNVSNLSKGIYLYKMQTKDFVATKRLVIE